MGHPLGGEVVGTLLYPVTDHSGGVSQGVGGGARLGVDLEVLLKLEDGCVDDRSGAGLVAVEGAHNGAAQVPALHHQLGQPLQVHSVVSGSGHEVSL